MVPGSFSYSCLSGIGGGGLPYCSAVRRLSTRLERTPKASLHPRDDDAIFDRYETHAPRTAVGVLVVGCLRGGYGGSPRHEQVPSGRGAMETESCGGGAQEAGVGQDMLGSRLQRGALPGAVLAHVL